MEMKTTDLEGQRSKIKVSESERERKNESEKETRQRGREKKTGNMTWSLNRPSSRLSENGIESTFMICVRDRLT